jgi:hypothetical protein
LIPNERVKRVAETGGFGNASYKSGTTTPFRTITSGIEHNGPTLGGFTVSGMYFQSNQNDNGVGYKKGQTAPFSAITGIPDPRGIASIPPVRK